MNPLKNLARAVLRPIVRGIIEDEMERPIRDRCLAAVRDDLECRGVGTDWRRQAGRGHP